MLRPRLLPTVILAASALLGIKLVELWSGGSAAIAVAMAETKPQPAADAPAKAAADAPPAANPPAAPASPAAAQANAAPTSADPQAKPAPTKPASADAPGNPAAQQPSPVPDPLQMSQEEIGELQQLARRRTELDKRAAELREREVLMQAAEKRIDEKLAKLQSLQKSIQTEAKTQDAQEDARLQSLVHMYEQMKPKDAARILDQLDIPVLLTMLSHMREMKAAPILATMDPAKAKAVTLALAEQRNAPRAASPPTAATAKSGQ
ncbi:MAG TPA: hypothetical protein VFA22_02020 [Stellaceae bacterium]|nr:hypothetical protein [Stellaceae bacterium]